MHSGREGVGNYDDAESAAGDGTLIAIAKRQRTLLGTIVVLLGAGLPAALIGGRLDVSVGAFNAALPAGTAHIGRVAVDSLLDSLVSMVGGRLDSIRRVDTLRVVANQLAGRLDSLRRLDSLFGIRANMTHIGRVAVDSAVPEQRAATLHVTGTAAVNTALTITLPAVAGQFHYITSIQWHKLYSVIGVAAGAGVICTSTNLPGGPAWTTEQLASAAGTVVKVIDYQPTTPLKSSVANTATTIVCPLQLQTIWRGNVSYFAAP